MSKSARVFVTQEQSHIDYCQAETFGDIVFCSLRDIPTVSGSLRAKGAVEEISRAMKGYQPGVDYIMPSGSPLNIAAVMIIAGRKGNNHNILKWDSRSKQYSKVALEVPSGI